MTAGSPDKLPHTMCRNFTPPCRCGVTRGRTGRTSIKLRGKNYGKPLFKKIIAVATIIVAIMASVTTYSLVNFGDKKKTQFYSLDSFSEYKTEILIKENCFWDNPGNKPWKGDNVELLKKLGLNGEEINIFLDNYKNDKHDSIVYISRRLIVEDYYPFRSFRLNMDMSSGTNILCKNTIPGRNWEFKEYKARLFIIKDKYILIPEICGNITRVYLDTFLFSKPNNFGNNRNYNSEFANLPFDPNNRNQGESFYNENKFANLPFDLKSSETKKIVISSPGTFSLMIFILFLLKVKNK